MTDQPEPIALEVGDTVRIMRDEFPALQGQIGKVDKLHPDGTTAWVRIGELSVQGAWCSVALLEKVATWTTEQVEAALNSGTDSFLEPNEADDVVNAVLSYLTGEAD